MSINWSSINKNNNRKGLEGELKKLISPDNYGFGKDQWNLTDIKVEPSGLKYVALQLISGDAHNGEKRPMEVMTDNAGDPMSFRIKVLSRQACYCDKDGTIIDGGDKDNTDGYNDTIAPKPGDKPKQGDMVRIKLGNRLNDPDTGEGLTRSIRQARMFRGEVNYYYIDKPVDKDGCIKCNFEHAYQILSNKGKRLVHPEFAERDKNAEKEKRPQRVITNWYFEEVPANYKAKRTSTGGASKSTAKDKTQVGTGGAAN